LFFSIPEGGNSSHHLKRMGEFMLLYVKTKLDVVLYNAFPFNLLKGLVITGFTMLVYKRIRPLLKGRE